MKKVIKFDGLCCANCAAKIEQSVSKLPNVQKATLSFMSQRLVIEADEQYLADAVEDAIKIAKKIEPDIEIV